MLNPPAQSTATAPPPPPTPPDEHACCQSGCVMCVYDLYQEELDRYRLALAAWQAQHGSGAGR